MSDQLTWGEWEESELPFEDEIPDAQQQIVQRANDAQVDGQDSLALEWTGGLYQIPTATSNPRRPRTVAAKFEPRENAIYVVMRSYSSNGSLKTPIVKYWPMTAMDWRNFRAAYSKGRYIALNWDGQVNYEEVSESPGGFDEFLLTAAAYARSAQMQKDGLQTGQSANSDIYKKLRKAVTDGRRVRDVRLRSDRLGGTGRTRQQKQTLQAAYDAFYRNKS